MFISHSRNDETGRALSEALRDHGLSVWSDVELESGTSWRVAIEAAINRCDVLLLIVEPEATRLQEAEWAAALARSWTGEKTIVPVVLPGARLPAGLHRWRSIKVGDVSDLPVEDVLEAIRDRSGDQGSNVAQSELDERLDLVRATAERLEETGGLDAEGRA